MGRPSALTDFRPRRRRLSRVHYFAYMLLTRRTFLTAALGGAAGVSLPRLGWTRTAAQSSGAASIVSTRLADNLFLLTGAGANVVALKAADGVVLVDGGVA